jgi:glutamyl-tRNA synthetase
VNTTRQRWLQKHLGWDYPEIINVGRLGLEVGILSKSKIRAGIEEGTYSGWDDARLGTLMALRKRGIQPETIRQTMIHVGPKPVNVSISWDKFASENRKLIEANSDRYTFIGNPVKLTITGVKELIVAQLPVHPDYPDRGTRDFAIEPKDCKVKLMIPGADAQKLSEGQLIRLMGAANIRVTKVGDTVEADYHSLDHQVARDENAPFVNWIPESVGIKAKVILSNATVISGIAEETVEKMEPDAMFQFERFGYCRVETSKPFLAYFTHK